MGGEQMGWGEVDGKKWVRSGRWEERSLGGNRRKGEACGRCEGAMVTRMVITVEQMEGDGYGDGNGYWAGVRNR